MRFSKKFFGLPLLVFVLLSLSGCTVVNNATSVKVVNVGGIFISANKGDLWKNKSLVANVSGKAQSFSGLDAASLVMDPSDSQTIYFGSVGSGLIYTYNGGESWQIAKGLGNTTIRAIAVDPKSKCTLYIAAINKVLKSEDCGRNWQQIYVDEAMGTVDNIAIDQYNSSVIYISNGKGDVLKSENQGVGWQTINRTNNKIKKIVINPNDSRVIYLATESRGIFYSQDSGATWEDLGKILSKQKFGTDAKNIVFVKDEPETILVSLTNGLLRSKDSGVTWDKIALITSDNKNPINDFAVNPKNSQEIYYINNTNFYRSLDGGQNWTPIKLPSDRAGAKLLIDFNKPDTIYLAMKTIVKK
jgi:photosystem II stability/assembly factor-like uncharacterized protein